MGKDTLSRTLIWYPVRYSMITSNLHMGIVHRYTPLFFSTNFLLYLIGDKPCFENILSGSKISDMNCNEKTFDL